MRRTHRRDDDDGLMKVRIRGACRILSGVLGNLSRPTRNWKLGGGGGGLLFIVFSTNKDKYIAFYLNDVCLLKLLTSVTHPVIQEAT